MLVCCSGGRYADMATQVEIFPVLDRIWLKTSKIATIAPLGLYNQKNTVRETRICLTLPNTCQLKFGLSYPPPRGIFILRGL